MSSRHGLNGQLSKYNRKPNNSFQQTAKAVPFLKGVAPQSFKGLNTKVVSPTDLVMELDI